MHDQWALSIPYNVVVWLKLFCQVLQPERLTFFWAMSRLPPVVWVCSAQGWVMPKRRPQPSQHPSLGGAYVRAAPEPDTRAQSSTRHSSSSRDSLHGVATVGPTVLAQTPFRHGVATLCPTVLAQTHSSSTRPSAPEPDSRAQSSAQEAVFYLNSERFLTDPLDPLPLFRTHQNVFPSYRPAPPLKTERERQKKPLSIHEGNRMAPCSLDESPLTQITRIAILKIYKLPPLPPTSLGFHGPT